jgi:hypothetical protein
MLKEVREEGCGRKEGRIWKKGDEEMRSSKKRYHWRDEGRGEGCGRLRKDKN